MSCIYHAVIRLNTFKYIDAANKKLISKLILFLLSEEQSDIFKRYQSCTRKVSCGNRVSGVMVKNAWFLINHTKILRQHKPQFCDSRNNCVSCILIYTKRNNFLIVSKNPLNGTARVNLITQLIAESNYRQYVLQGLEKQKTKLAIDHEKEKTNSNKIIFPVNGKSKEDKKK